MSAEITEDKVKVMIQDQAVTKGECIQCQTRERIITDNLSAWLKGVDRRVWWLIVLGILNLLSISGYLLTKIIHLPTAAAQVIK